MRPPCCSLDQRDSVWLCGWTRYAPLPACPAGQVDACNGNLTEAAWAEYRDGIERSGREMVLSICAEGLVPVWQWGARVGHMWRVTGDIENVRRSDTVNYRHYR